MDEPALFSKAPKAKRRKVAAAAPAAGAAGEAHADKHARKVEQTAVEAAPQAAAAAAAPAAAPAGEDVEAEAVTFRQLGLSEWLDRVCAGLGMQAPTQVQRGTIPAVLAGRNVIGVAHTGSGKTAAFALPILQKLAKDPFGVFALVLTPTR